MVFFLRLQRKFNLANAGSTTVTKILPDIKSYDGVEIVFVWSKITTFISAIRSVHGDCLYTVYLCVNEIEKHKNFV